MSRVVTGPLETIEPARAGAVEAAITVALVLEAFGGVQEWMETDPSFRLLGGLLFLGRLALVALACQGVWARKRWGYWLAGVGAVLVVALETPGALMLLSSSAQAGRATIDASPLSVGVTVLKALAYLAFLAALIQKRRHRQR